VIEACLSLVKDLLSNEQERSQTIADKASNLLGFAGVIGALSVSALDLITSVRFLSTILWVILGVIYLGALAAIFATVWLALGGRKREIVAVPHIDGVFGFQSLPILEVKRRWLADLISTYYVTTAEVNRRVDQVYGARVYLAAAIFLLLLLAGIGAGARIFCGILW